MSPTLEQAHEECRAMAFVVPTAPEAARHMHCQPNGLRKEARGIRLGGSVCRGRGSMTDDDGGNVGISHDRTVPHRNENFLGKAQ